MTLPGRIAALVASLALTGVLMMALPAPTRTAGTHPPMSITQARGGLGPVDPRAIPSGSLSGNALYTVTTNDSRAVPTWGLAIQVRAMTLPPPTPEDVFQINGELDIGSVDILVGLFSNETLPVTPFWAVYNRTNDIPIDIQFDPNLPIQAGAVYTMKAVGAPYGTGLLWTFTVDSTPLGSVSSLEVGNSTSSPSVASYLLDRWDQGLYVPTSVDIPCIMATDVGGSWRVPRPAQVTYSGPPSSGWGLEGRSQDPSLAPGEIVTGSTISTPANGTTLWETGPANLTLSLAVTGGLAPDGHALGREAVNLTISVQGTADLAGLPINWTDHGAGGSYESSTLLDSQGQAANNYTPLISLAPQSVNLSVSPGVFGWGGVANLTILVDAAVIVGVQLSVHPGYIPSGLDGQIDVRVTYVNGTPIPGALVKVNVTPNHGGLYNPFAVTDAEGVATLTFDTPPLAGKLHELNETFAAVVLSPGLMGNGSGSLVVGPPLPPPTPFPATDLAYGVGLGFVAVGLLALIRWRWGPHKKIPELPLSHAPVTESGEAYTKPPVPPVS